MGIYQILLIPVPLSTAYYPESLLIPSLTPEQFSVCFFCKTFVLLQVFLVKETPHHSFTLCVFPFLLLGLLEEDNRR